MQSHMREMEEIWKIARMWIQYNENKTEIEKKKRTLKNEIKKGERTTLEYMLHAYKYI